MILLILGTALAGPPFHACDTSAKGVVGFIDPKSGSVYVLDADTPRKLGSVPVENGGQWPHVLLANPTGGWLADVTATQEVRDDGTVRLASEPKPYGLWAALRERSAAAIRGDVVLTTSLVGDKGVVYKTVNGANQVALWRFEAPAGVPQVLHLTADAVYNVTLGAVEKRGLDGSVAKSLPLPDRDTIGLCGGGGPPLTAITLDRDDNACVQRWDGKAWKQVACVQ